MTAYNRADYLFETLSDLAKCTPEDWHFFISVDPSDKTDEIRLVLDKDYGFASKTIVINEERFDHRKNQHAAIKMAFDAGSNFNLHLDDDLFISPDALELANYYERTYRDKPLTFGSYCLFNYDSDPIWPTKLISRSKAFTGLGWSCFRENWKTIFHPNWFNDIYSTEYFSPSYGWDWNVAGFYKKNNISEIYPAFSRTNHRGKFNGTCCSEEFYDKSFSNLQWNKDLIIKDYAL